MIARPETLTRIREQADAHAQRRAGLAVPTSEQQLQTMRALLNDAYLAGADAGYTARCAEEAVKP